jgi:hypothetical protein
MSPNKSNGAGENALALHSVPIAVEPPSATAARATRQRSNELFTQELEHIRRGGSRIFAYVMVGQWLFAIVVALIFSPYGWSGKVKVIHEHVYLAVILGGLLSALPVVLLLKRPTWEGTRHVVAVAQMLWSALLIHLTGGRIETHFHVFGSLAFLSVYRDWKVLGTATSVVVVDQ